MKQFFKQTWLKILLIFICLLAVGYYIPSFLGNGVEKYEGEKREALEEELNDYKVYQGSVLSILNLIITRVKVVSFEQCKEGFCNHEFSSDYYKAELQLYTFFNIPIMKTMEYASTHLGKMRFMHPL